MDSMSEAVNADPDTAKRRLAFRKSYSQEHSGGWHRHSLIEDAKLDTVANAEFDKQEQNTTVTDAVIIKENKAENEQMKGQTEEVITRAVILTLRDTSALSRVFRNFENCGASVQHVESRRSQKNVTHTDVMVSFLATRDAGHSIVKSVRQSSAIHDVILLPESKITKKIWFPRHISDLDRCQHLLSMYDPDLDQKHPGFSDLEYRARRKEIADIAFSYRHGQIIPNAEYSDDEVKTWGHAYRQIKSLLSTHACQQYIVNFKILEKEGLYSEHSIPQLNDVSKFLQRRSGFQLRPVAGLLSARDFLASLAFRVFQCTQYVRHPSNPDHTVEPDCIHELIGHVPMLADPSFAQFSQEIGLASLGTSDDDIEKFATLYWFSVEFGLCKQAGEVRAYGAALMSSYGELVYSLSDEPQVRPFNPSTTALQEYQDQDFQPIYFLTESFEGMKEQMRRYAASITRPYEVRYDPYTQSIQILDDSYVIEDITHVIKAELNSLCNAFNRLQKVCVQ